jgi:hypothetical protein
MEFKRLFIFSTVTLILMIIAIGCGGDHKLTAERQSYETGPGVEPSASTASTITPTSIMASKPISTAVAQSRPTATDTPVPTAEPKPVAAYLIGDGRVGSNPKKGRIFLCHTI